ncbi:unnamed protein product [Rotaria sp. Silwood2]|nr:unnamed protein product [Rotaria sp. Silwood2]
MFKEENHFDSEKIVGGSKLIMKRYQTTLDAILKTDNYNQGPIGFNLLKKSNPKGKWSRGDSFDRSPNNEPTSDISKDKFDSVHGHLYYPAATITYKATLNILTQLQKDIACSIGNYVHLAKDISINIVNQYGPLEFVPHNYILISFNSDYANFMVNSHNPNNLIIDIQQLNSFLYTFTDLPARDAYLKYEARALLRNKRIVIYSLLGQQIKKLLFKR